MAWTKQRPRNPVMERPLTAMGSDVQGKHGKRMPTKPTSRKTIEGGKQLANIYYTRHLNNTRPQEESRNHIDIDQVC